MSNPLSEAQSKKKKISPTEPVRKVPFPNPSEEYLREQRIWNAIQSGGYPDPADLAARDADKVRYQQKVREAYQQKAQELASEFGSKIDQVEQGPLVAPATNKHVSQSEPTQVSEMESGYFRTLGRDYATEIGAAIIFLCLSAVVSWLVDHFAPRFGIDPTLARVAAWLILFVLVACFTLLIKGRKKPETTPFDPHAASYPPIQIINSPTFNNNPQMDQHVTADRRDAVRERPTPKPRKRSNLQLRGVECPELFLDRNEIFQEAKHDDGMLALHCAVLRFCNEPIVGQAGQPLKGLRAMLHFRNSNGHTYAPIDRAPWVRERYNSIDLEVGSCRMLVIAWRGNKTNALTAADHHYSDKAYDRAEFLLLEGLPVEVDVTLIAGDGGYVMYKGSFRLDVEPELQLTEIKAQEEKGK